MEPVKPVLKVSFQFEPRPAGGEPGEVAAGAVGFPVAAPVEVAWDGGNDAASDADDGSLGLPEDGRARNPTAAVAAASPTTTAADIIQRARLRRRRRACLATRKPSVVGPPSGRAVLAARNASVVGAS